MTLPVGSFIILPPSTYRTAPTRGRAAAVTGGSDHYNDGSCIKADNRRSKTMSKLKCLEWKQQITISFTAILGAQCKSHKRLLLLGSVALPALQNGKCTVSSHSICKAYNGVRQTGSAKQRCSVYVSQVRTVNVKVRPLQEPSLTTKEPNSLERCSTRKWRLLHRFASLNDGDTFLEMCR
jgi:hypothetical protein